MSGKALVWAANVRGLKATTKIVLIQLAERHNKDTGLCNPSIKTLAEDCEMDRSTVIRHLELLESFELITRVRKGNEDGGRASNEYVLHMPVTVNTDVSDRVKSQSATRVKSQSDGGLSRKSGGVKSQSCATRTCLEPDSEPNLFGSYEPHSDNPDDRFEELWATYPKAANQSKQDAKVKYRQAIKSGVPADTIISAAERYSDWLDSGGPKEFRPNPKHLATWLSKRCWNDEIPEPSPSRGGHRYRPYHGEVVR